MLQLTESQIERLKEIYNGEYFEEDQVEYIDWKEFSGLFEIKTH